jgi:hypothetical protein
MHADNTGVITGVVNDQIAGSPYQNNRQFPPNELLDILGANSVIYPIASEQGSYEHWLDLDDFRRD